MKATIEIQMNDTRLSDQPVTELADVLRGLVMRLDHASEVPDFVCLRDSNGNVCGKFEASA